jgi:hypothetical protein
MYGHFAEAEINVPCFAGATSSHDHSSLIHPDERPTQWGDSVNATRITW